MPIKGKTQGGPLSGGRLAVIGAGFMGGAIVRGLIGKGTPPASITAYDPSEPAMEAMAALGALRAKSPQSAILGADAVILAVKPQSMAKAADSLKKGLGKNALVISIAAGISTEKLESWLAKGARVIRAMPNIAAQAGQSATALCRGRWAGEEDMEFARAIFGAVGAATVVDEGLMDAVTGLSGSGPAYVFLFLEALIDAGVKNGLSRDAAGALARQTLLGAAQMACQTGEHPSLLKDMVASPGGTTIAALSSLEEDGFKGSIIKAVTAAAARSRELGGK